MSYRQYRICVAAGRCSRPLEPFCSPSEQPCVPTELFEEADEQLPVTWVNGYQAAEFCAWIGRRLPSSAEWERAARGPDGRLWPWGDEAPDEARANLGVVPPFQLAAVDDPAYAVGATPEGIWHLVGNVREWTSTPNTCSDTPYSCTTLWNGRDPVQSIYLHGHSWYDPNADSSSEALAAEPIYADLDRGFRCAK